MGILKELVKGPAINKLYTEYFCELEASFKSYDTYIREKEESNPAYLAVSKEEIENKISVLEYDSVNADFDINSIGTEYVLFVSDLSGIASKAAEYVVEAFETNDNAQVVYGDEDEYNSDNSVRLFPWFKPAWSPDTLKDYMYFGNAVAFRTLALKDYADTTKAGETKGVFGDIYDMSLKITEGLKRRNICHTDRVLFHSKSLKKLFTSGTTAYNLDDEKIADIKVSVVIPSKDNPEVLDKCISSFIRLTRGIKYEIIVVDNGSSNDNKTKIEKLVESYNQEDKADVKYLYKPQPFNFSRMCNQGAAQSNGEYLLFLNDDIEIREGKWLIKMMRVATRRLAGAVGAKLYYPDSMTIQHAGIVNLRLGPVHKLQFKDDNPHYYMDLNNGVHNCIAVTGACLLVSKAAFNEVGGFAEELEVAFNDVDLCFRLYEAGYYNSICNNTHLWHYESMSRGADSSDEKLKRLESERELLYTRHPNLYAYDPFYSESLNNDILDTNYSFVYEYDYHTSTYDALIKPFKRSIKDVWYNECLMVSLEYAGDLARFEDHSAKESNETLLSGYAFVAGSDNAMFRRSIVLMGENNRYIFRLPSVYRPDLEMNLDPDENALMCGFSVVVNKEELKRDNYRICVLAESGCSRLKLFGETNKYIRVE